MQAGLLNQYIEIYKPTLVTNDYGEHIQNFERVRTTKAQVINDSGNKQISNNEVIFTYSKTFKVRRYIQLNETYLIKYQEKYYNILSLEDNRKYNELIIKTELRNE